MTDKLPTFRFETYTLRPALIQDLGLASWWTAADPTHARTTKPEFWLEQTMKSNSFVLEDRRGEVFFFKITTTDVPGEIEIHIQFAPHEEVARHRVMAGLIQGFRWLQKELSAIGFKTIYFNSADPGLIYFCSRRLGFVWDGRRLIRRIPDGEAHSGKAKPATEQRLCSAGS